MSTPDALVIVDAAEWAAVRKQIDAVQALLAGLCATLTDAAPRRVARSHRYTRVQAAERLCIGLRTLDALVGGADGYGARLHAHREGRRVHITEGAILDYEAALALDAERRASGRSRRPRTAAKASAAKATTKTAAASAN